MKHRYLPVIAFFFSLLLFPGCRANSLPAAEAAEDWNIPEEIRRLYKEAPSIAAYPDVPGVVWLNSYKYDLTSGGTMRKNHKYLILCGQYRAGEDLARVIPVPRGDGASLVVTEASWYNPVTGMKEGTIPVKTESADGFDRIVVTFPKETEGRVVAIVTQETHMKKDYLDDLLFLVGQYPVWEQHIELNIPDGLDLFWQGEGVREPSRRKSSGREIIAWSVMNQPIWDGDGIVDTKRPSLVFSLRKGISYGLRSLQGELASSVRIPRPADLAVSDKTSLMKTGESIASYMLKKQLTIPGYAPRLLKARVSIPENGLWTPWEQTLIAKRWLESLGHTADLYWNLAAPIPEDGPAVLDSWAEPVLVIKSPNDKEKEFYYKADQSVEFGKTPPSLCGATIYRMNGANLEKRNIPKGNASDHTLAQTWKLALDESGIATGTLEILASGAWADLLGCGRAPSAEYLTDTLSRSFILNVPGLTLSLPTVRTFNAGYRIVFTVRAALGIVSGNRILMRVPAAVPKNLEEISTAGERYSIRFPFTLEQNLSISTPRGYRVIGTPPIEKQGDSKAMLDMSMVHWPKRGELEVAGKWVLRTQDIDESLSKTVLSELNSLVRWSQATLPLKKR